MQESSACAAFDVTWGGIINDDCYGTGVFPSFAKEGWTRPKENAAKHPLWSGRGGCLRPPLNEPNRFSTIGRLKQPPRLRRLRNGAVFFMGAATPPSRRRGISVPRPDNHSNSVLDQRDHVIAGEAIAALQEFQLDHERDALDFSAELLRQADGGSGSSTGRQQVVCNDDARARLHRILVDFQRVRAVLEVVRNAFGFCRELLRFAHRYESRSEVISQRRREDETTSLDSENKIRLVRADLLAHRVDDPFESGLIF